MVAFFPTKFNFGFIPSRPSILFVIGLKHAQIELQTSQLLKRQHIYVRFM